MAVALTAIIAQFAVLTPARAGDITWTAEASGTTNVLRGVSCPSVPTCFAVGDAGTILATTNGGSTWMTQTSGTNVNLRGVSCPSTATCFAVGDAGAILATANGGNTWMPQISGTPFAIYDVSCASTTTCFAVGDLGKILVTTNGSVWTKQNANTTVNLRGVSCPSTSTCFVVGASGVILATFNTGSPWTAQTSGTTNTLRSVSCVSTTTCFAVGDAGTVLATINGGFAWTKQSPGTTSSLYDVSCVSLSTCFAAGVSGVVLDTTTGGSIWTDPTPDTSTDLNSLSCPFATACYAVGGVGTILTSGTVSPTGGSASGIIWTTQTSGVNSTLRDVSCPSTTTCFAVSDAGTILATTNGGNAWTTQTSGTTSDLESISCPSTSTCFAVGWSIIVATTNGGSTWTAQGSGAPCCYNLADVSCPSTTTCFAVGHYDESNPTFPTILATTDGGTTWTAQASSNAHTLSGVSCPSTTTCFAVGDHNGQDPATLSTTNGGITWNTLPGPGGTGISCPSTTTCYVAGGSIDKTINAGTTWTPQYTETNSGIQNISCPSTTTCYAVGNYATYSDLPPPNPTWHGTIVGTTDGGNTWAAQTPGTTNSLESLACPSATNVCLGVGGSGAIVIGPGPWLGAITLVAGKTSVIVGGSSTLTANASASVTGTGSAIQIFDDGGEFVTSCGIGTSCRATVTQSAVGAHNYIAYVAAPGTSYPASQVRATSNAATVEWTQAASPANVDRAGARIRYLGETSYPSVYAGVSVDEAALTVNLQVTSLGPETTAMVQAANGVAVAVNIVPRSYTSLMTLNQNVADDEAYWTAQSVTITEFGVDALTDTLFIGIDPYSTAAAADIQARYGSQNVTVGPGATSTSQADRKHDSSPWNGGNYVSDHADGSGRVCTTGFGIHKQDPYGNPSKTGPYLILAGHCFPNGTVVYNNGIRMGTVSRNSNIYKSNGDDIELIAASSSRHIWETNTGTADSDGSMEWPATGSTICHSGAATNKKCGTLKYTNRTVWDPQLRMYFAHQDVVTSSGLLAAGGDSGGPWFTAYTSGIRYFSAVGVHRGSYGSTYTCNTQLGSNSGCANSATYTEAYQAIWVDYGGYWVNQA